jgi:glycosyltransferase involved in cell wall biosynthesis
MINIFSRHFPPPKFGGVQSFFYAFIQQLDEEVNFYTHRDADFDINILDEKNKKKINKLSFVPPPRKPNSGIRLYISSIKTFFYFISHKNILKKEGIHFGQIWPYGIAALFLKKIYGIKYTIFLFGEEISKIVYNKSIKYKIIAWSYRKILSNASNIQVSSSFVSENLKKLFFNYPPKNINIFYNGIEPEIFCNEKKTMHNSFNPTKDEVIIFSVSRHIRRKGFNYLIDAVSMLNKTTKNWHLYIGGEGPETINIESTIKELNLESCVTLLGRLTKHQLHYCYNRADIFVLTNILMENGDADGCPIVFLEAACYSIPSLGGNVPGTSDAIIDKETGFIANSKNAEEVSKNLEILIKDAKLRSDMGGKAYKYVNENYKWSNRIEDFRIINEKILN